MDSNKLIICLQINIHSHKHTHTQISGTYNILGAILYTVCAVSILQVTGGSVGVENTQVFWTISACRGTIITDHLKDQTMKKLQSSLISV